jgi:hypothetical protein
MTVSANKQRIQYDGEWTSLFYHCVCVTTQFDNEKLEKLGDLDALYAECIVQKEALNRDLQAYVLEGALDDEVYTYNCLENKTNAPDPAAGVKKTPKKPRKFRRSSTIGSAQAAADRFACGPSKTMCVILFEIWGVKCVCACVNSV